MPKRKRRWWWTRKCLNCGDPARCLCPVCLRAILVPMVLLELIRRAFSWWG